MKKHPACFLSDVFFQITYTVYVYSYVLELYIYIWLFFSHHSWLSHHVTLYHTHVTVSFLTISVFLSLSYPLLSLSFFTLSLDIPAIFSIGLSISLFESSAITFFLSFLLLFLQSLPQFYVFQSFLSCHSLFSPSVSLLIAFSLSVSVSFFPHFFFISAFMPLHSHHLSPLRPAPLVCVCV